VAGGGRGALEGLPPIGGKLVQEVRAHVVHEFSSGVVNEQLLQGGRAR
jgi:hypothetical protein